jgi:hypothetical protein
MKTNDMLMYGGLGLAAYMLLGKKVPGVSTPVTSLPTNSGTVSPTAGYTQFTPPNYAAMVAANPNVQNPNYILSHPENAAYGANYLDMQQWVAQPINNKHGWVVPDQYPDTWTAVQWHWTNIGCAQKRSFIAFTPMCMVPWSGPPINTNAASSGGGSSWLGSALSIAGSVIAMFGVTPVLNDAEAEVLITGSYIGLNLLPFYYGEPGSLAIQAEQRVSDLVKQYTK